MIEVGSIVKNLIPGESVVVNKVQRLGASYSISYTGVNSRKSSSKVIKADSLDKLVILTEEGKFNFPVEIQIKGKLFLTFLFMAL